MNKNALHEITEIVGSKYIITDPDEVKSRSQDIIPNTQTAAAFVYPATTQEIQAIVGVANKYKLALWPVSRGLNWGYGGASPAHANSVVLVLERMNRILEVNSDLAYAIIEPGVSFRELHEYLKNNNIPLWIDCTDGPPDGSVVGNSLERGIGETDYGDHFGNICGLEVVLPNGNLLRTGGGPMQNFKSWSTYKWGIGPYIEGLFSQSNFGIVTKMGLWLRPIPESFVSCIFELNKSEDLPLLIDGLRHLQLHGILQSKVHLINDTATTAICIEDYQAPEETLRGYKISSWSFAAGIYGTPAHTHASVMAIKKALGPLGKLNLVGKNKIALVTSLAALLRHWKSTPRMRKLSDWICRVAIGKPLPILEILPHVHAIEQGFPSDHFVKHAYLKSKIKKPSGTDINPVRDACGLVWLGPMVPLTGKDVFQFLGLVEPLFKRYGFQFYVALMVGNARTAIILLSIFYDKANPEETLQAQSLYFELGKITQEQGYQQYRTSTMYMDHILTPAPEFQEFCQTLKKSIDPTNIMAPGKYGL